MDEMEGWFLDSFDVLCMNSCVLHSLSITNIDKTLISQNLF